MELTLSVLDPSSSPISKLSSAQTIQGTDLFLVARPNINTTITDAELDKILFEQYGITADDPHIREARMALRFIRDDGWRLNYQNMSARLLTDISASFGFNNMAYKEDYEYSLKNHVHQYSTVRVFPTLTYEDVKAMYSNQEECTGPEDIPEYLGKVKIYRSGSEEEIPLYSYHIEFPKYQDPDIGEVRFLALTSLPTTTSDNPQLTTVYSENDMLYDKENDGYWVYPNGQTINCPITEFQAACKVYGQSKNASDIKFTVPKISDFIKPYPKPDSKQALSSVAWQTGLLAHSDHKIDNSSINSNTTLYTKVTIETRTKQGHNAVHSGDKLLDSTHKVACISADVDIQNICNQNTATSYSDKSLDKETYPKHQQPVCIVYIGRRYA